jgi:hypothetical protein
MSKQDIIEILYWLEHTTLDREEIIRIFREKLNEDE